MSDSVTYAGIDIGGTSIKYGLVDSQGKILFKKQRPTVVDKGAEPLIHLVTNIAEGLMYHAAEEDHDVRWLGVGTPGAVDARSGTVIGSAPNIDGWQGMAIGSVLGERLNMPVHVDNDVNAMALAESRFGAGVGYDSIVCVAVGTGVGGGIVLNGKLWRGANHTAGEIGHIVIDPNGPECRCGNRGCVEAFCSSAAIIARVRKKLGGKLTPAFENVLRGNVANLNIRKLFEAAKKGDKTAIEVIDETAEYLASGLASVVNLFNPEIVIIGGGVADAGSSFVTAVSAGIRRRANSSATEKLRVARATLGNSAGFVGAGILGETR
ncbi:MAG: ROK family protein [Candidatus Zixiibacteriota bacterium]|nr:MAG: ROK family protein [candidate division Zixibacteria bacterium]